MAHTALVRDRYELVELVGHGGQGEVWLAIDRTHGLKVAIKVRPDTSESRDALEAEARVLHELTPLIGASVVREGFSEQGRHYLVMEWVDGRPLSLVLLEDGPPAMELATVVDRLTQVADALDLLHSHEPPIVHGDVKPANLVLCEGGRVVLVDFGASQQQDGAAAAAYGTRDYLAPEIAVGAPKSPASDVYALAATAYVLLTGAPPRPGDSPDLSAVPRDERDRVLAALDRGLAVDPARRPPTAGAFMRELAGRGSATEVVLPVRLAHNGSIEIPYQVFGRGEVDVFFSMQDVIAIRWEEPRLAAFLETLGSFSRVIFPEHPPRGRLAETPEDAWNLDSHTEDIRTVLDHARSQRCVLVTNGLGAASGIKFAARYPERTAGLVVVGGQARFWAAPDYPLGLTVEAVREKLEHHATWLGSDSIDESIITEHAQDDVFRRWLGKWLRFSSPAQPRADGTIGFMDWDVRDVLPSISAPTIVVTEADGYLFDRQQDLGNALYLAEHIPNARFVDSPKPDWYFLGEHGRVILNAIETLVREVAEASR